MWGAANASSQVLEQFRLLFFYLARETVASRRVSVGVG